ncbi:reverse transcriptase [Trichonephila clavipes]|nr:reverse transcriptase [Trichonephila clavipes]
MTSNKADAILEELKTCALEMIEEIYLANEWLHIYTDGSYLLETNGADAGWFCRLFEGSLCMGKNATNYNGEVLVVCEARTHLLSVGIAPAKIVFFIDSQAAILALKSNTSIDYVNTIQCQTKIVKFISYGWTASLQWVLSHVGIHGNERADQKAKHGAKSTQPEFSLTLRRAKSLISPHIDKHTAMTQITKIFGKPWEILATVVSISRNLEKAEAVARFRPTTVHDFLEVYLYWLGMAANEAYPLCGDARMDDDHPLRCTGLVEYPFDDIVSRYWEVRRQMVKKPSPGVG